MLGGLHAYLVFNSTSIAYPCFTGAINRAYLLASTMLIWSTEAGR